MLMLIMTLKWDDVDVDVDDDDDIEMGWCWCWWRYWDEMMLMLMMSSWWMYVVYVHGGCSDLLDILGKGRGSLRIFNYP